MDLADAPSEARTVRHDTRGGPNNVLTSAGTASSRRGDTLPRTPTPVETHGRGSRKEDRVSQIEVYRVDDGRGAAGGCRRRVGEVEYGTGAGGSAKVSRRGTRWATLDGERRVVLVSGDTGGPRSSRYPCLRRTKVPRTLDK